MSSAESPHPGADMERFVREQMAFVGLREEDVQVIRHTAPFVLKHEAAARRIACASSAAVTAWAAGSARRRR